MSLPPDSLAYVLEVLAQSDNDDWIYSELARLDGVRLGKHLKRLDSINVAKLPKGNRRKKKKQFEAQRSRLKGRVYEALVGTVLRGVKCFNTWHNVNSTTNELDILVVLGPSSKLVPAMRDWGSHCICECKYHDSHVSTNWVTKLNTVLQTHGSQVGILFSRKGIASKGRGAQIRQLQQLLAVSGTPRYIVSIDSDDLLACTNGQNFLKLVVQRFVEMRAGVEKLGLAVAS